MILASAFGSVHDFFHSSTWYVIRNLAIFFVIVFWVATVYWVLQGRPPPDRGSDARLGRRPSSAIVPFIGPLIYMLFRPPEYLEDVRERELEIKAMEKRLGGRDLHCPVCRAEVDEEFLDLPGLHDEAAAGLRQLPSAARGAVAGVPVLRDADRARPDARWRSPRRSAPPPLRDASVPVISSAAWPSSAR